MNVPLEGVRASCGERGERGHKERPSLFMGE